MHYTTTPMSAGWSEPKLIHSLCLYKACGQLIAQASMRSTVLLYGAYQEPSQCCDDEVPV